MKGIACGETLNRSSTDELEWNSKFQLLYKVGDA